MRSFKLYRINILNTLESRLSKRPDFSSFFERGAEAYLEYVAQAESMKKGGRAGFFDSLKCR